ncbi:MAG: hypothetical protein ACTSVI_10320 [Promethearchaeota archaeon]
MTDDKFNEDEEYEPKKSKFPVKGVLKGIVIMILFILGMFLINQFWGNISYFVLGFMLLCLASYLLGYKSPKKKKIKHVYSLYQCMNPSCNIRELHEFKEGDYIFKRLGSCWKCDSGELVIIQIFAVETESKHGIKVSEPTKAPDPLENI